MNANLVDQCKSCGLTVEYWHGRGQPHDAPWCVRGTLCADKPSCGWLRGEPTKVEVRIKE